MYNYHNTHLVFNHVSSYFPRLTTENVTKIDLIDTACMNNNNEDQWREPYHLVNDMMKNTKKLPFGMVQRPPFDVNKTINIGRLQVAQDTNVLPHNITPLPKSEGGFIGRELELQKIEKKLHGENEKKNLIINGISGVGKTALLKEYVAQNENRYDHLLWIDCKNKNFVDAFLEQKGILSRFDININSIKCNDEKIDVFREINFLLRNIDGNVLMVIDDLSDDFNQYYEYMQDQLSWKILAATKNKVNDFSCIKLEEFNREDAVNCFKTNNPKNALFNKEILDVVDIVDYHPLMIKILAQKAEEKGLNMQEVVALAKKVSTPTIDYYGNRLNNEILDELILKVKPIKLGPQEQDLMTHLVCIPNKYHEYNFLKELLASFDKKYGDYALITSLRRLEMKGVITSNYKDNMFKLHKVIAQAYMPQLNVSSESIFPMISKVVDKKAEYDNNRDSKEYKEWHEIGQSIVQFFNGPASIQN